MILRDMFLAIYNLKIKKIIKQLIVDDFDKNNYLYFLDTEKAQQWGDINYSNWENELIKIHYDYLREIKTDYLKSAYDAIRWYCGYRYKELNEQLRTGEKNRLSFISDDIMFYLDEELSSNYLKDNIVVVRWVNKLKFIENVGDLKVGKIIREDAFLSTSLDLNYKLCEEAKSRVIDDEMLLIIKIPKGSRGLYVSNISGRDFEQEVLLPRGSELEINKIYHVIFSKRIMVCTVIDKLKQLT